MLSKINVAYVHLMKTLEQTFWPTQHFVGVLYLFGDIHLYLSVI